jgi:hypothetical protein
MKHFKISLNGHLVDTIVADNIEIVEAIYHNGFTIEELNN